MRRILWAGMNGKAPVRLVRSGIEPPTCHAARLEYKKPSRSCVLASSEAVPKLTSRTYAPWRRNKSCCARQPVSSDVIGLWLCTIDDPASPTGRDADALVTLKRCDFHVSYLASLYGPLFSIIACSKSQIVANTRRQAQSLTRCSR